MGIFTEAGIKILIFVLLINLAYSTLQAMNLPALSSSTYYNSQINVNPDQLAQSGSSITKMIFFVKTFFFNILTANYSVYEAFFTDTFALPLSILTYVLYIFVVWSLFKSNSL